MAILKFKKLVEDLENNTSQVLSSVSKVATTASYAGTGYFATSAGNSGTSYKATSAGNSGSASYASTAAIAGTAPYAGTAYRAYGTAGTILQ
jgi:hypothetical protein